MKVTGKRSISSIIKIFLIILFISCIISMISAPILIKNIQNNLENEKSIEIITQITFLYTAAIPALIMILEFEKIFSSFEKEIIFSRKIEKRLKRTSMYCLLIGIIFSLNALVCNFLTSGNIFETPFKMMYLIIIILMSMIFLILSIGMMVLKNVYKVAIDNKEENDLTI